MIVDVFVYLTRESVHDLVKDIEHHFNMEFNQFSSSGGMTIDEKLNEYTVISIWRG